MRWERMLSQVGRLGLLWIGVVVAVGEPVAPAPYAAPPAEGWVCTNRWVVVDTETTGLSAPIHVIEIAAQRMVGWLPEGPPFRIFIDHGVTIPAASARIHGYDAAYLTAHGLPPLAAHAAFRAYVDGDPLVFHNLAYDWNRALAPEWQRLGIVPIGERGFCTLLLARRVLADVTGHGLEALKTHYGYDGGRSHHADDDVATSVRLLQEQIGPRLEAAGITDLAAVRAFSRRTPVAACRARIAAATAIEEERGSRGTTDTHR